MILLTILYSCSNKNSEKEYELHLKNQELRIKEREILLKQKEEQLENQEDSLLYEKKSKVYNDFSSETPHKDKVNEIKYAIAYYRILGPKFKHTEFSYETVPSIRSDGSFDLKDKITPSSDEIFMTEYNFVSDIKTIENYNEDEKFRFMDEMENKIHLKYSNINFGAYELSKKQKEDLYNGKFKHKILNSEVYVYDTYKEASIKKSQLTD